MFICYNVLNSVADVISRDGPFSYKSKRGRAICFCLQNASPQIHGLILLSQIRNFVAMMAQIVNPIPLVAKSTYFSPLGRENENLFLKVGPFSTLYGETP
jgi:hypothetical protein